MGFHFVFLSLPILPDRDPDNLQLLELVGSTSLSSQAARGCCFGFWVFCLSWVSVKLPSFVFVFWSSISEFCQLQNTKIPNGFFAAIPEEIFLWPFDLLNSSGGGKKRSRIYIENEQQESTTTAFSFCGWILDCVLCHGS